MGARMESVVQRQKGAYDFSSYYDNLCILQDSAPLTAVKVNIEQGFLDLNVDRIRLEHWPPLLKTLKINKSLSVVSFRSYYDSTDSVKSTKAYGIRPNAPCVRNREVSYQVTESISDLLKVSPNLKILELEGLCLRERDIAILSEGLAKTKSLKTLSLAFCKVSDRSVECVTNNIKNSISISWLDLTCCGLTWRGAEAVSKIIQHQSTLRHSEAWMGSLRYRMPNLDGMGGLRRITINGNPMVGDEGCFYFSEALRDDLWLKALDMQRCGITSTGAKHWLNVLRINKSLVILDLRKNPLIDRIFLKEIMERCLANCSAGQDSEYLWQKMKMNKDISLSANRHFRGFRKLSSLEEAKPTAKVLARIPKKASFSSKSTRRAHKPGSVGFVPWRTEARLARHKGFPPDNPELDHHTSKDVLHYVVHVTPSGEERKTPRLKKKRKLMDIRPDVDHASVEELREMLLAERRVRKENEARILDLELQISRLRRLLNRRSSGFNSTTLSHVEATFDKFNKFLDLLNEAGLGKLTRMAGIQAGDLVLPGGAGESDDDVDAVDSNPDIEYNQDYLLSDEGVEDDLSVTSDPFSRKMKEYLNKGRSSLIDADIKYDLADLDYPDDGKDDGVDDFRVRGSAGRESAYLDDLVGGGDEQEDEESYGIGDRLVTVYGREQSYHLHSKKNARRVGGHADGDDDSYGYGQGLERDRLTGGARGQYGDRSLYQRDPSSRSRGFGRAGEGRRYPDSYEDLEYGTGKLANHKRPRHKERGTGSPGQFDVGGTDEGRYYGTGDPYDKHGHGTLSGLRRYDIDSERSAGVYDTSPSHRDSYEYDGHKHRNGHGNTSRHLVSKPNTKGDKSAINRPDRFPTEIEGRNRGKTSEDPKRRSQPGELGVGGMDSAALDGQPHEVASGDEGDSSRHLNIGDVGCRGGIAGLSRTDLEEARPSGEADRRFPTDGHRGTADEADTVKRDQVDDDNLDRGEQHAVPTKSSPERVSYSEEFVSMSESPVVAGMNTSDEELLESHAQVPDSDIKYAKLYQMTGKDLRSSQEVTTATVGRIGNLRTNAPAPVVKPRRSLVEGKPLVSQADSVSEMMTFTMDESEDF